MDERIKQLEIRVNALHLENEDLKEMMEVQMTTISGLVEILLTSGIIELVEPEPGDTLH